MNTINDSCQSAGSKWTTQHNIALLKLWQQGSREQLEKETRHTILQCKFHKQNLLHNAKLTLDPISYEDLRVKLTRNPKLGSSERLGRNNIVYSCACCKVLVDIDDIYCRICGNKL